MMKKITTILLPAICAVTILLSLSSCRKASINGKLDAQWQIMKIEHLADGTVETPELRSYINLNLHVVNLRYVRNESAGMVYSGNMHYDKDKSTLTMDFPYNKDSDKLKALQQWGIYTNPIVFDIMKLDNKQLVLKSPETIVTCRRY